MRNGLLPACKHVDLAIYRQGKQVTEAPRQREVVSLSSGQIWEWVVDQGGDCGLSGVCGERCRAMTLLSLSLISSGNAASGRVVPIRLVEDNYGFSYERLEPPLMADCRRGIIKWQ